MSVTGTAIDKSSGFATQFSWHLLILRIDGFDMDLVFSWFADSGAWPEHPGAGEAVLDCEIVGPSRLLDHVETMLGLGRPGVANVKRIAVYRRKIEAAGSARFWSESFAFDPWSSARELLRWRDELVEAGWRAGMGSERSRLANLSAVEAAGPELPFGRPDRLRAILDALDGNSRLQLQSVSLVDRRETLPAGWCALVDALEHCGVRVEQIETPNLAAPAESDLGRLIGGDQNGELKRDGSLTLLAADTELMAAEALAAWFAADADANAGVTFVLGEDTALLDHALVEHGLPRLGATTASPHRALLQILPLAFALAWEPPDPNRLLDFLLLPVGPLRRFAANRLADVVAKNPGVGGEAWQDAWIKIDEELSKDEKWADPSKRAARIAEWREFVEPTRHNSRAGMPLATAKGIASRVKAWASSRFLANEDALFLSLSQIAGDLIDAIDATGVANLDRLLIERMIEEAIDGGAVDPGVVAEAAPWRFVSHPGGIWGPSKTIVWWRFSDAGEARAEARWNDLERADLASAGCPLDPPELELRRLSAAWERPLRHAAERLVLVVPAVAAGLEAASHPLWHSLSARRKNLEKQISVWAEDVVNAAASAFAGRRLVRLPIAIAPEPQARAEWSAPAGAIKPRELESASSLESLLSCPLQWTLKYANGLRPGLRQSLPRIETLIGTIAHRIAEEIFRPGPPRSSDDVEAIARQRFDDLLPRMGATLLLPGAAAELALARRSIPPALAALSRFLKSAQLTVVSMESTFDVKDTLAPGTGVTGRIDLHAQTRDGRPVIVDLKWYRTDAYLRRDLKNGTAFQIATYARHVSDARVDAGAGYFALRQGCFLTAEPMPGEATETVAGPSPRETWERTAASFTAAIADLAGGRVRASFDARGTALEKFTDAYLLAPPKCGYCDFSEICGAAR